MQPDGSKDYRGLNTMEEGELSHGISSKLLKAANSELAEFAYQLEEGHKDDVLCVDASDSLQWVLSGGMDSTARLWHLNIKEFQCYRLYMNLKHNDKVTSVAFAGEDGPAITVTEGGDCMVSKIWCEHGQEPLEETTEFERLFNQKIVDVRVKREDFVDHKTECLSLASGSWATLTKITLVENNKYEHEHLAEYDHTGEAVLAAQHMPGDVKQGAALATATKEFIRLWSLSGEVMTKLPEPQRRPFSCFHLIHSEHHPRDAAGKSTRVVNNWGWLAAGADNFLTLWPVQDGKVRALEGDEYPEWPVSYEWASKICDVTISPHCTTIIVQRDDNASEVRAIAPKKFHDQAPLVKEDSTVSCTQEDSKLSAASSTDALRRLITDADLVKAPEGFPVDLFKPEQRVVDEYCESFVVEHTQQANEICIREVQGTSSSHKRMCVGFADGSVAVWELPSRQQHADGGQPIKLAELRSMTFQEMMTPIIIRLITFAQVTAFAFGPATDFAEGVDKPMKLSRKLVCFDISEMAFLHHLRPSMLFYPQVYFVMALIVLYLIIVYTGAPERLTDWRSKWVRDKQYGVESNLSCSNVRPYHVVVSFLFVIRSSIGLAVGVCSTILVVPMFKVLAKVVDCFHPEDGSKPFLSADPHMQCYGTEHVKLLGAFAILVPLYFSALLPYAVVSGDSKFMLYKDLWQPSQWRKNGITKATLLYQGPMHPNPDSIFGSRIVELLAKIALPVIVILTTQKPLVQTSLIFIVGISVFLGNILLPPMVDQVMTAIVQGMQLFTVLCMACGVFTVASHKGKELTAVLLISSFLVSVGVICARISSAKKAKRQLARSIETDIGEE